MLLLKPRSPPPRAWKKNSGQMTLSDKRLYTAYLLKKSFGQMSNYPSEGWPRKFFQKWRAQLKWQRLNSHEKFAEMIDQHWDGIAAYCDPRNKVSLGIVDRLNNKIRVI